MRAPSQLEKDVNPAKVTKETVELAADALQASNLLTVSECGTKVKRTEKMRDEEELKKQNDARSLYARPFPMDADIDKLSAFFGEHGKVLCVHMRKNPTNKAFKGSVFVEFEDVDTMKKVCGWWWVQGRGKRSYSWRRGFEGW
jgi:lupus La protein